MSNIEFIPHKNVFCLINWKCPVVLENISICRQYIFTVPLLYLLGEGRDPLFVLTWILSTQGYLQANHLAFFRRTLGTRLGSTSHIRTTFRVTWSTNTAGANPKFVQKGVWGGKVRGENFGKFACLFRQTLHLVLYNIDLEVSQLLQSPAYLAGNFSVSYSI